MFPVTLHLVVCVLLQVTSAEKEVTTKSGKIAGKLSTYTIENTAHTVIEYLGIPFAEPPTGENRFKPPVAKQPWDEPLNATNYSAMCVQNMNETNLQPITTDEEFSEPKIDEDCLYLNIYRPNKEIDEGHAVMVFLHGGDFVTGSGMLYSGAVLTALHDVIVVTINYRLGVFGFLSDGEEDFPGNYGILDQKMAIDWLHDNIEVFGGDPSRITLFGSGAGGSSVHLHTIMGNDTSFTNAIVQSAKYDDAMWTKETARERYSEFLSNVGIDAHDDNISENLRDMRADYLLAAQSGPWRPVISDVLPVPPREAMVNGLNLQGINLLVGSNSLDGFDMVEGTIGGPNWYNDTVRDVTMKTSEFYEWTEEDIEDRMMMFNSYYGGFMYNIETISATDETELQYEQESFATTVYTDQLYRTWAQEIAMTHTDVCDCSVYKYQFGRRLNGSSDEVNGPVWTSEGASHGGELPYVFGFITISSEFDQADVNLSYQVMYMWTEFAKNHVLPINESTNWDMFESYSSDGFCRATVAIDAQGGSYTPDGATAYEALQRPRNWDFWQRYYSTLGLSCDENLFGDEFTSEPVDECEPGVWSDAGIEMSNDTAGALLIAFIVLTAFFLLAFSCACYDNKGKKKRIRKLLGEEDTSSIRSNAMSSM